MALNGKRMVTTFFLTISKFYLKSATTYDSTKQVHICTGFCKDTKYVVQKHTTVLVFLVKQTKTVFDTVLNKYKVVEYHKLKKK